MREIKFRAWDEENKQMIQWNDEFFYDTSPVTRWSGYFSYIEMPLMQYIGLKDKNGKEIYEGDIVEHYMDGEVYHGCEVVFEDGMFCFKNDSPNPLWLYNYLEVVGNIYEKEN